VSASEKIARLRELRAKATGPYWSCKPAVPGAKQMFYLSGNHDANNREVDIGTIQGGYYSCEHNAAAIVAAMNSLEGLLRCADALQLLHARYLLIIGNEGPEALEARAALQALAGGGE
jgi:hypothetical protein